MSQPRIDALTQIKADREALLAELEAAKDKYPDEYEECKKRLQSIITSVTNSIAEEVAELVLVESQNFKNLKEELAAVAVDRLKRADETKVAKYRKYQKDKGLSDELRKMFIQLAE